MAAQHTDRLRGSDAELSTPRIDLDGDAWGIWGISRLGPDDSGRIDEAADSKCVDGNCCLRRPRLPLDAVVLVGSVSCMEVHPMKVQMKLNCLLFVPPCGRSSASSRVYIHNRPPHLHSILDCFNHQRPDQLLTYPSSCLF
jgi:hypothetical protein